MRRKRISYRLPVVMILLPVCVFVAVAILHMPGHAQKVSGTMNDIPRIAVDSARAKSASGEALLICAYDSDERFNKMRLDGAISLSEFQRKLPDIPRNKEIIFYCA